MKRLCDQDYYEVLEVAPGASPRAIERAYQIARSAYADESLAAYSVFESVDRHDISERVEQAYRVLIDEEERAAYDLALGLTRGDDLQLRPLVEEPAQSSDPTARVQSDFENELEEEGETYDGPWIRRARMRRGIEIEQIAETTKVSATYLRCIEEESFKDLPAEVYVRGFVTAYVSTMGLDPNRVVPPFMTKFREARSEKRKGFMLGGK